MREKYSAFTLIETLIVLAISCMLLLLPSLKIKSWLVERKIDFALQSFEKNVLDCQQQAILTQKKTRILVNFSSQTISYHSTAFSDGKYVQTLPDELVVETKGSDSQISFTAGKGNPSAIFSVVFKDELSQRRLKYQSQMGAGRVICYETKI